MTFKERLLPLKKNTGFKMEGYYVWCGSPIKGEDGRIYLFASRWPKSTGFPQGYMKASDIVLAVSDSIDQPFEFQKLIIGQRPGGYWDSQMAHNPQIVKVKDQYVLYYIGSPDGSSEKRAIGYACCPTLTGEWVRSDLPIALPPDANNPAVFVEENNKVIMAFRNGRLQMHIAKAESFDSEYRIINNEINPGYRLEDPFIFKKDGLYQMIVEDNQGQLTGHSRYGAHLVSEDAITWRPYDPVLAYDHTLVFEDGDTLIANRRERPQLLIENNKLVALFTSLQYGDETWNIVQKIKD